MPRTEAPSSTEPSPVGGKACGVACVISAAGVGEAEGAGLGDGLGEGDGDGLGEGVGVAGSGTAVGVGVAGAGEGDGLGDGEGDGLGFGVGVVNTKLKNVQTAFSPPSRWMVTPPLMPSLNSDAEVAPQSTSSRSQPSGNSSVTA